MPCGLLPSDCVTDHDVALTLHLHPIAWTPRGEPREWGGPCPVCKRANRFSLGVGSKGQRLVWFCHHKPACSSATIREAMLAAGIRETCIPVSRGSNRQRASVITPEDAAAWVELPATAIRLRLMMFALDCGPWEAAEKLGLSRSAAYRALSPVPKSGTEPQVSRVPKSGTVKHSTTRVFAGERT